MLRFYFRLRRMTDCDTSVTLPLVTLLLRNQPISSLPDQSENCNYDLIFVDFNMIW